MATNTETRVALVGIIVENSEAVPALNDILHEFGQYVVGRMGIPYRQRGINVISIVVDAPQDVISTLSGRIGRLDGINSKVIYDKMR